MIKIGLVGCGTIGSLIAQALDEGKIKASLAAIYDLDEAKSKILSAKLKKKPVITSLAALIDLADLTVECASVKAVKEIAGLAFEKNKDIFLMSTGGLLINPEVLELAEKSQSRLYLPSGAIVGIDGLKAASIGQIDSVTLTTRKPPASLSGAPYILEKKIDLEKIDKETILFEGTAKEAVEAFPKNVNVAATLSFAGIGPEKTRVRIITSPGFTANSHEIKVKGEFGEMVSRTDNLPAPDNPKTSFMAPLSAIACLQSIVGKIKIGT